VETQDDGSVTLSLNDHSVPELHVSREFSDMLDEYARNRANQSKESREAMLFLKQKMDSARNFINAVKQRQQTMLSTMKAIIDLQMPPRRRRVAPAPHDPERRGRARRA